VWWSFHCGGDRPTQLAELTRFRWSAPRGAGHPGPGASRDRQPSRFPRKHRAEGRAPARRQSPVRTNAHGRNGEPRKNSCRPTDQPAGTRVSPEGLGQRRNWNRGRAPTTTRASTPAGRVGGSGTRPQSPASAPGSRAFGKFRVPPPRRPPGRLRSERLRAVIATRFVFFRNEGAIVRPVRPLPCKPGPGGRGGERPARGRAD